MRSLTDDRISLNQTNTSVGLSIGELRPKIDRLARDLTELSVRMPQEMRILMLHSDLSEQISSWLVSLLEVLAKEWALFPFNRDAEFHVLCRMFSASLFQGVREVFSQAGELDPDQLCEVLRIYFGLFLTYVQSGCERRSTMSEFIEFRDVRKVYKMGEVEIPALDGVSFQIKKANLS